MILQRMDLNEVDGARTITGAYVLWPYRLKEGTHLRLVDSDDVWGVTNVYVPRKGFRFAQPTRRIGKVL